MGDDNSEDSKEERPRTETEDLLKAQLVQQGEFDNDDTLDGLYHG